MPLDEVLSKLIER